MRQITIELPISILPNGSIPEELLRRASAIRFLRLDFSGFLFISHIPSNELKNLMSFLKKHYRALNKGEIIVSSEGNDMILVSGRWWNDGRPAYAQEANFAVLDAICRSQAYFIKSSELVGNSLRITIVSDFKSLKTLQTTFHTVGLSYSVKKLSGLERHIESAFDKLTKQQLHVLRLAYAQGYYDVPRKISTEQLANLLQKEKGTVGEHLRRAEKKIMDFLITT